MSVDVQTVCLWDGEDFIYWSRPESQTFLWVALCLGLLCLLLSSLMPLLNRASHSPSSMNCIGCISSWQMCTMMIHSWCFMCSPLWPPQQMSSAPPPPSSHPHPSPKLTRELLWTCLVVGNLCSLLPLFMNDFSAESLHYCCSCSCLV